MKLLLTCWYRVELDEVTRLSQKGSLDQPKTTDRTKCADTRRCVALATRCSAISAGVVTAFLSHALYRPIHPVSSLVPEGYTMPGTTLGGRRSPPSIFTLSWNSLVSAPGVEAHFDYNAMHLADQRNTRLPPTMDRKPPASRWASYTTLQPLKRQTANCRANLSSRNESQASTDQQPTRSKVLPPTADIECRVLEMLGRGGIYLCDVLNHNRVKVRQYDAHGTHVAIR
jgi:hypothetical protein